MTETDARRLARQESTYVRFVIAFGSLVAVAVVAALMLIDRIPALAQNWVEESRGVTVLALVTVAAMVAAAACAVGAFVSRALMNAPRA